MAKIAIPLLVLVALHCSSAEEAHTENRQGRQFYPSYRPEIGQLYFSNPWHRYYSRPYQNDGFYYPAQSSTSSFFN